jgi:carboxyl-terminal processing protease
VALVRIELFSDGTSDELAIALDEIHSSGATGIVLDLRGNPGGLLNEAVWVASEFLASGDVLAGRDAAGVVHEVLVDRDVVDPTTPLVVLIDAGSASSSEIVAGALQDAGRATLVGETTSGTGTILSDYPLDDGSVLSIGTLEWLTRNGQSVWHTGVTPDITVGLPAGTAPLAPGDLVGLGVTGLKSYGDIQLLRAMSVGGPGRGPSASEAANPGSLPRSRSTPDQAATAARR